LRESYGDRAAVLAGGQSLVPLLCCRAVRPQTLIDINRIAALDHVEAGDTQLRVGALTRQASLERDESVLSGWSLLAEATGHVGDAETRNRGTVGGSVAHADPAAQLPAALLALDARIHARSSSGTRVIPAAQMFTGHCTTSLRPDELLVEIEIPRLPGRTGTAFRQSNRMHGVPRVGSATTVTLDPAGRCEGARIALLGVASRPLRATAAEHAIPGTVLDRSTAEQIATVAVEDLDPTTNTDHRRALLRSLIADAVEAAAARAMNAA
jgi:CO/xanthine dehydrogenase FAD-binding subunit